MSSYEGEPQLGEEGRWPAGFFSVRANVNWVKRVTAREEEPFRVVQGAVCRQKLETIFGSTEVVTAPASLVQKNSLKQEGLFDLCLLVVFPGEPSVHAFARKTHPASAPAKVTGASRHAGTRTGHAQRGGQFYDLSLKCRFRATPINTRTTSTLSSTSGLVNTGGARRHGSPPAPTPTPNLSEGP